MLLSTPSRNRTSARSLSHNTENAASDFKEDLAIDICRAQTCDIEDLLKYKLSRILKADCKEKEELDSYQNSIEELERKLDDEERRAEAAKQENVQDDSEDSDQSNLEITQWKDKLDQLRIDRQMILDRLWDECLKKVLPISNDPELLGHLNEYSKAKRETDFYSPFVHACNVALDRMGKLPSDMDMFRPASSLNCRFHRNDPMHIKSDYLEKDSGVSIKPDVIITSTVVAEDLKSHSDDSSAVPEFGETPKRNFDWRQTLCCTEFKRSGSSLGPPSGETEAPPAKRAKIDASGSTAGPSTSTSQARHGSRGASKTRASKTGSSKGSGSMRKTKSSTKDKDPPPKESDRKVNAQTQCAMYAMEMLSYTIGVHHAITLLVSDCELQVWYYDRQGVIRSTGINFVRQCSSFLVLLFVFQRFDLTDWGVITELNPGAVIAHNERPTTDPNQTIYTTQALDEARLERKKKPRTCSLKTEILDAALGPDCDNLKEIRIYLEDWLSNKPHSLAGRATAVVGASDPNNATEGELACKISFPEVAREGEGTIIEELRVEIEGDSKKKHLVKHLPEVLVYGDMSRYGTQRVRSILQISIRGYRTFRILISRKLLPLTNLVGETFVKAWLEVVRFHAFLWTIGVEHGDPSLWNVMYNEGLECGVLGDYDLAISRRRPRVLGTERTGTIPFMALDLLSHNYWDGKIERLYQHELEAFTWILPFVFLRYQDKKSKQETPVDKWMTSDYVACRMMKSDFRRAAILTESQGLCQPDHKDLWILAKRLLIWWQQRDIELAERDQPLEEGEDSATSLWPLFVDQLAKAARKYSSIRFINELIETLDLRTL